MGLYDQRESALPSAYDLDDPSSARAKSYATPPLLDLRGPQGPPGVKGDPGPSGTIVLNVDEEVPPGTPSGTVVFRRIT